MFNFKTFFINNISLFLILISFSIFIYIIFTTQKRLQGIFITKSKLYIKKIIDFFAYDIESPKRKALDNTVKKAGLKNSYYYYFYKFLIILTTFLLAATVAFTNWYYQVQEIMIDYKMTDNYVEYFNTIVENYGFVNLLQLDRNTLYSNIFYSIKENFNLTASLTTYISQLIYTVFIKISEIKINIKIYLIVILLSFFVMNIYIYIRTKLQEVKYQNDLPAMKTTTLLFASLGMPVNEILKELTDISACYKPIIEECLNNYSYLGDSDKVAIMNMATKFPLLQFRKLCMILRDLTSITKEQALDNLKNDIELDIEEKRDKTAFVMDARSTIALILSAISFTLLLSLLLIPVFIYIRKFDIGI